MRLGQLLVQLPLMKLKQLSLILNKTKPQGQMGSLRDSLKLHGVVGGEVSIAIIDFFKTGRLLKQLNATLLTLIPKILVSRIRESLDLLISPSQNAFVSGRLISDNVLLAQELFSGYNQCRLPPRCALKVDLRKAYDTVEWHFLIATLQIFGFPAMCIRWIEECVTTTHYSVVVNGGVHGFFAGARGLRQGDPMSPYLLFWSWKSFTRSCSNLLKRTGNFGTTGDARN
ncbi:hypothetical protein Sango_3038800 [Sesamum angolense]|uniref:Reverse transcriptase domain-containing protein n=1 Tax=Sesamum angolense TaxID=2727404 RepID=A0AAE1TB14_9LAMI|nr:hypothetical protein Sango_3038800 [Sesamum angolense]